MAEAVEDYRKYVDPAVLAGLSSLDLRARRLVQGFISGMHRSPFRGFSVEFAEHREYVQGDDLRHIDWKVYGRTDKHYVKLYEQDSNLQLLLVVDDSESMQYRSSKSALAKRDYAITAAAALAFLALQQADAVGLATFDTGLHRITRPSNHPGQWKAIVHALEGRHGGGKTTIRPVLNELAESLRRRHVIIILSDLLADPRDTLAGLKHLRHEGHEPLVMQILDDAELNFPFTRPTRFAGLEGDGSIETEPRVMRDRYMSALGEFLAALRTGCHQQRVDYELFNTCASMKAVLGAFLATRTARLARRK